MRKVTCTNDVLKLLKEYGAQEMLLESEYQEIHQFLSPLIVRLEAAEKVIAKSSEYDLFDCPHFSEQLCKCGVDQIRIHKEFEEAEATWRKSKGEGAEK